MDFLAIFLGLLTKKTGDDRNKEDEDNKEEKKAKTKKLTGRRRFSFLVVSAVRRPTSMMFIIERNSPPSSSLQGKFSDVSFCHPCFIIFFLGRTTSLLLSSWGISTKKTGDDRNKEEDNKEKKAKTKKLTERRRFSFPVVSAVRRPTSMIFISLRNFPPSLSPKM